VTCAREISFSGGRIAVLILAGCSQQEIQSQAGASLTIDGKTRARRRTADATFMSGTFTITGTASGKAAAPAV
jgi:hypothetical protein